MKNSIKILLWAVFLVTAFIGCSDTPGDLGTDVLKDDFGNDIIIIKEFNTRDNEVDQTSEVFAGPDSIRIESSGKVLLGKLNNVNSKFLIKFNTTLPDSVLVPFQSGDIEVVSAKLEIFPNIIVGKEDQSNFSFEAFKLDEEINLDLTASDPINFANENLISNIVSTDTLITADISTSLIADWLKEEDGDSTANYGALFTANNSIENVVRINSVRIGESTYDIKVVYVVEKENSWKDTLVYYPQTSLNIIDGTMPSYSSDEIVIQGGIPSRANYWLNTEQFPKDIAVNNAYFQFFLNEENSFLRKAGADTLELSLYVNEGKDTLDFGLGSIFISKETDQNYFKGDATFFVQRMLEADYKYGFRIKSRAENANVSKIVLKSNNTSDPSLRPKLTVKYSQRNK